MHKVPSRFLIKEEQALLLPKLKSITLALFITIMAIALVVFPQESFDASKNGLHMWWQIVFPSLLPFLIISELLICFGVVSFLGVMFEPLMRPFFRVPGVGGFVWAMGLASGFPAGAKFTARLRLEKQLTRIEGERLVSFTNSSNPLFIFVAVSVGFFQNPKLGILLAAAHYGGNMIVGFIMRFYGQKEEQAIPNRTIKLPSVKAALKQMHRTRLKETRPFGKMLGDSVTSSIHTLLMIGGFIILFSVINQLLSQMNVTALLAKAIAGCLQIFSLSPSFSTPFISGLFEMTLGAKMTSSISNTDLLQQAMIASFILAFSGLSVQAQVASILAETDIRFAPFFFARVLHGFIAAILAYLLWNSLYVEIPDYGHAALAFPVSQIIGDEATTLYEQMLHLGPLFTIISLSVYTCIIAKRIIRF
ncbi:sporulation integral membrane protein YlbJ [Peribacillus asahii]|uniref:sporulation integral membrane protein YlbJ n=1 Tax=Peribacillus asahii TaxID=228899 RepID=UPI00380DFD3C